MTTTRREALLDALSEAHDLLDGIETSGCDCDPGNENATPVRCRPCRAAVVLESWDEIESALAASPSSPAGGMRGVLEALVAYGRATDVDARLDAIVSVAIDALASSPGVEGENERLRVVIANGLAAFNEGEAGLRAIWGKGDPAIAYASAHGHMSAWALEARLTLADEPEPRP